MFWQQSLTAKQLLNGANGRKTANTHPESAFGWVLIGWALGRPLRVIKGIFFCLFSDLFDPKGQEAPGESLSFFVTFPKFRARRVRNRLGGPNALLPLAHHNRDGHGKFRKIGNSWGGTFL